MNTFHKNTAGLAVVLATLIASLFVAVPGFAQYTSSVRSDDSAHMKTCRSEDACLEVTLTGIVEFLPDDTGIKSLSPNGSLYISERNGNKSRTLDVFSDRDGTLSYKYRVNDREVAFDKSARDDVAALFLTVIRESGINADIRVARILAEDGVSGVFREIENILSSSSNQRYFTELVVQGELETTDLIRLADWSEDKIPSSGGRSRFLRETVSYYLADRRARDSYFKAIGEIPSSGDKTRVLLSVISLENLNTEVIAAVYESAQSIPSSGDRARLLIAASKQYADNDVQRRVFFEAVNSLPSSGDHTRVLLSLLSQEKLAAKTITAMFESAQLIPSSGDRARLLIAAAVHYANDRDQREAFFEAVNSIPSSGDRARVLLRLLDSADLDRTSLLSVLDSAGHIPSSSDKTRVLVAAAHMMTDDELVDAYMLATEQIPASGDQRRALSAIMGS